MRAPANVLGLALGVSLAVSKHGAAQSSAIAAETDTSRAALAFATAARAATERYRDQSVAIADGYRPIGPAFPGMGEHWVNGAELVRGELAIARPQILEYAPVHGRPALVGVAYAVFVGGSDSAPNFPEGVAGARWHFHSGSVEAESFLHGHHEMMSDAMGPRIAVLHAWIWIDNPAGLFATDNWALPFAELGLAPPRSVSPAAGKALSLATGGEAFLIDALMANTGPAAGDSAKLRATVAMYADRARAWAARHTAPEPPDARAMAELDALWDELWTEIERVASPTGAAKILALKDR